jgi:hypothetical protein
MFITGCGGHGRGMLQCNTNNMPLTVWYQFSQHWICHEVYYQTPLLGFQPSGVSESSCFCSTWPNSAWQQCHASKTSLCKALENLITTVCRVTSTVWHSEIVSDLNFFMSGILICCCHSQIF